MMLKAPLKLPFPALNIHSQLPFMHLSNTPMLKLHGQTTHSLANNSVLGHDFKVLASDNVTVTSGRNKDVGAGGSVLHGAHFVTGHGGLEGVDGVNLGDEDTGTVSAEGLGALCFSWRFSDFAIYKSKYG